MGNSPENNRSNLIIRAERPEEWRVVEEVTREAFWNHFQPGSDEHFLLHKIRESSDFIKELDFVAEVEGKIVGNIVYTKSRILLTRGGEMEVATFGPVCVLKEYRCQGIARKLIEHSLEVARTMGIRAVVIYGDPRLYGRLGFRCAEKYDIMNSRGMFSVSLMVMELVSNSLDDAAGQFVESEVFDVDPKELELFDATFPVKEKISSTPTQLEFSLMCTFSYKKS